MPHAKSSLQVLQRLDDYPAKFSDKIDRLYISNASFDLKLIFTDVDVHTSSDLIAILDKESGHLVPHYITEPGNIRLIWRTFVQVMGSRDSHAVGFRLLAYTDCRLMYSSREHLLTKVTPDLHLTYDESGGGGNLELISK